MNTRVLSGLFGLFFFVLVTFFSFESAVTALHRMSVLPQWSSSFEKAFRKALPTYDSLWTGLTFYFFHQGKEGLIHGRDQWLLKV